MNGIKQKIIVRAPVLTRTGYGEHGRFVLRAFRTIEDQIDLFVQPIKWGSSNWIWEDTEERVWLDGLIQKTGEYLQKCKEENIKPPFDYSLQVTIPNEWQDLAAVNIGVTAGIETTKVAPVWLERANMMSKVITVSEHSKKVYTETIYPQTNPETGEIHRLQCQTPVEVIHYPVKKFENINLNLKLETKFNFLTVAQWGPRKNMTNTIRWFVEEFIDNPNVGLVIKTFAKGGSIIDRDHATKNLQQILSKYENRQCKVYLLHGDLTDQEMDSLYKHPSINAFVSLSHGEGFGLPHFEAAYSGLPIIASPWSGYMDFLCMPVKDKKGRTKVKPHFVTVDYGMAAVQKEAHWEGVIQPDSMWSFPEQGSYKMRLREVYKDYGRFKKQAKTLQKWILKNFTAEKQYAKFTDDFKASGTPTWLQEYQNMVADESSQAVVMEALT
jgi:glycosyltransferase involved in cell wall biosynthesis